MHMYALYMYIKIQLLFYLRVRQQYYYFANVISNAGRWLVQSKIQISTELGSSCTHKNSVLSLINCTVNVMLYLLNLKIRVR